MDSVGFFGNYLTVSYKPAVIGHNRLEVKLPNLNRHFILHCDLLTDQVKCVGIHVHALEVAVILIDFVLKLFNVFGQILRRLATK